jgi:hypothetical protein
MIAVAAALATCGSLSSSTATPASAPADPAPVSAAAMYRRSPGATSGISF